MSNCKLADSALGSCQNPGLHDVPKCCSLGHVVRAVYVDYYVHCGGLVIEELSEVMAAVQNLAEYYKEAGFLKTYGNVSEAAKYLFKERLKARVTPTFYFFRNGGILTARCANSGHHSSYSKPWHSHARGASHV